MKRILLFLFLLSTIAPLIGQDNPAYKLYNKQGKQVKYAKMIKALAETDVVLFGEIHNDPISHWLQLEVTQDLMAARKGQITMGMEMFEADNQLLLDEYFSEAISEKYFEDEVRLWENYLTDYKPLILLAKENQLSFIATNIPRRYANMVYKKGMDALQTLSEEAKSYIAPLPIEVDLELSSYKSMLDMMGGHGGDNANFPKAQAIKDATMAWFITQSLEEEHLYLHYHGAFHSNNYEGINWYLHKYQPKIQTLTISTALQADIDSLSEEHLGQADFIICVPENMCKTH